MNENELYEALCKAFDVSIYRVCNRDLIDKKKILEYAFVGVKAKIAENCKSLSTLDLVTCSGDRLMPELQKTISDAYAIAELLKKEEAQESESPTLQG